MSGSEPVTDSPFMVTKQNRLRNTLWAIIHLSGPNAVSSLVYVGLGAVLVALFVTMTVDSPWLSAALVTFGFVTAMVGVGSEITYFHFRHEVLSRRFPQWMLRRWMCKKGETEQVAVANPFLTADTIRWAYSHVDARWVSHIMCHPNTPLDVLKEAWQHALEAQNFRRIETIVNHPNLDYQTFRLFLNTAIESNDLYLISAFTCNPLLTANDVKALVEALERHPEDTRQPVLVSELARHPVTPTDLLERWSLHPSEHVRKKVAENPNTPLRARTLATLTR